MNHNQILGQRSEQDAENHLIEAGLKLIHRNFRCKLGEIDLIMKDQESLVFVEVRVRNHQSYGSGLESVTPSKQTKIRRTALFYLQQNEILYKFPCRFDVIAVNYDNSITQFDWVKDAFY